MLESFDPTQIAGTVVAILTGVGSSVFLLRRKLSKDNLEVVKDRAETDIISHLERQRDFAFTERDKMQERLRLAVSEREEALQRVSKLSEEVGQLSGQVRILRELVERLGESLDSTKRSLDTYMIENTRLLAMIEVHQNADRRPPSGN